MIRSNRIVRLAARASALYLALWLGLVATFWLSGDAFGALEKLRGRFGPGVFALAESGYFYSWLIAYTIGLAWMPYLLERVARLIEERRAKASAHARPQISVAGEFDAGGLDPLDPTAAWYGPVLGITCLLCIFVLVPVVIAGLVSVEGGWHENPPPAPNWLRGESGAEFWALLVKSCVTCEAIWAPALALATAMLAVVCTRSRRARQSLTAVAAYSLVFAVCLLAYRPPRAAAADEEYDLPAGGGNDSPQAMSVKVQQVVRKRYVINPYSAISFAAPPPIENIDPKLTEETANRYQVGMGDGGLGSGDGEGGGFGSGKDGGKIRFIRLSHSDKSWDKNFGIGGDRNLLMELVVRFPKMKDKVAEETEARSIAELGNFKPKASPPLVYVGGAGTFAPSAADKKVLTAYLKERHGMILGDALGGGFGGSFRAAMTEVTGVEPVTIPRDDPIHKRPFEIPQLPIVVAHGGTAPLGWKIDGRWAVYYHPGSLSDAWRDDRAGIKKSVADDCYKLGINIISYAHREHDQWRRSQQP